MPIRTNLRQIRQERIWTPVGRSQSGRDSWKRSAIAHAFILTTITKTRSGRWKAIIRGKGWPNTYKTFRIKRDAEDWARVIEDEMIRGRYVYRRNSVQLAVSEALERIISTKKKSSREGKIFRAKYLSSKLGQYDLRRVLANRGHQDNFQLNG